MSDTPPPPDAALDVAAVAAEARALLDAATVECTGSSARWCPVCGDCTCGPRYEGGSAAEERTLCDDGCPLHAPTSHHGGADGDALNETALTFARHLVALAARVTAAEAAQAALAVARKAMIDAGERYRAAWDAVTAMPPTAAQSEEIAAALRVSYEAQDALSVALDALLRGAPGGYVRASVVAEYVAAADAILRGPALWEHVDAERAHDAARTALDAALAAAGST